MAPRIISVINQKGGVGKTTFSYHLAHRAHELGRRVLVIDLDTQGNASTALTERPDLLDLPGGAAHLFGILPRPLPTTPVTSGMDLLHGHARLDAMEPQFDLDRAIGPWRQQLKSLPYDTIVIDTPPSLGSRQVAALLWSDHVLIPLSPDNFAIHGLTRTLELITSARRLNPQLTYEVIINRYQVRKSQDQRIQDLAALRDLPLRRPFFPLRTAVSDAMEEGHPVWKHRNAKADLRQLWLHAMKEIVAP